VITVPERYTQTDGQTDRRTDGRTDDMRSQYRAMHYSASRGKNNNNAMMRLVAYSFNYVKR